MEELGLVERRQMPRTGRTSTCISPPQGRALKAKLVPLAEEVNRVATRGVRAEDIAAMRRVLELMLARPGGGCRGQSIFAPEAFTTFSYFP